ncbi:MAG: GNAT family N-acetyltransferase [Candidatus Heimdallarchaeota archaeon]|nr:GNAT family N-acetyltransferase [Candidatus Heimdallarchaeota archaeon]
MKIDFKSYDHDKDFSRIKDFLQQTYVDDGDLINWTIERWNYAAFFIRDMFEFTIEKWSETIGIWENEEGEIVSLVLNEAVGRGETFFQINPSYKDSIPFEEMFDFAEKNLQTEHEGYMILRPRIREGDRQLEEIARDKGYVKREDAKETTSIITLDRDFSYPDLLEGYVIKSMADDDKVVKRTKAFARAFGNWGTKDEVQPSSYLALQKAPDYRKDLDIYIEAPDGEIVSFCLIWYDDKNKIGILEPVGTDPDHRRKGLAKATNYEAINRAKKLGAKKVYVGDGQQFYLSIGFQHKQCYVMWEKKVEK